MRESGWPFGPGLCAVVVVSLIGVFAGTAAPANDEQWEEALAVFKAKWVIDKKAERSDPRKRAKKRDAVNALRKTKDARAIPILLGAHKKQLRFVAHLLKGYEKRRAPWLKRQEAMERELQARSKAAGGATNFPVSPGLAAWRKEQKRLENLFRGITHEQELAEHTRKAMATVVNKLEGDERAKVVKPMIAAGGKGKDPDQLEFIRLLGYLKGDDITAALTEHTKSMSTTVVETAVKALGRQNVLANVDTLLPFLEDRRWQVRVATLEGLSFLRDARVVEALIERLGSEDGVLQRHYYTALARLLSKTDIAPTPEAVRSYWKANQKALTERWAARAAGVPIEDDLLPVEIKGDAGSTSFYGIKTYSKHIIFVIDISGSMGEHGGKNEQGHHRIDVVKRELKNAIRSLNVIESDERGEASFNLVAYEATVKTYKSGKMIPATKKNKEKAFAWIDSLKAFGATNIYDAIEQAFSIISSKETKNLKKGADTIFLMTDGQPNRGKVTDPHLIRQEVGKLNRTRKITIHTIGVGKDHNKNFLSKLAAENNGEYLAR